MTGPTATCELWIGGARVRDDAPDLAAGQPTALSGLTLTWGRDDVHEQPGPATCTFDLLDHTPDPTFLDTLHVGAAVQVWAVGIVPARTPAPWGPNTLSEGSMPWPDGPPPADAVRLVGGGSLIVAAGRLGVTKAASVDSGADVPPLRFQPAGSLPAAWDGVPRMWPGDTWLFTVTVTAPAGVGYRLAAAGYSAPYATAPVPGAVFTGDRTFTGTGAAQTVTAQIRLVSVPAGVFTVWAGLAVRFAGALVGRRWQDQTGTWAAQTTTWADPRYDATLWADDAMAQPAGYFTRRRVLAFSGAVSDVAAAPAGDGALSMAVTAADLGADLTNRVIGDVPWPVQTIGTRTDRVAELAGVTVSPRVRVDTPLGDLQVSARDVDAQPAYTLLQDLAQSAGGVLWAATHQSVGAYLWMENPANRSSTAELALDGGLIVIVASAAGDTGRAVSACDLLEESVSWVQDTGDVSTVVAVSWAEQGVDGDGQPTVTDRTVTVTDAAAVAAYGTRRLSVGTDLIAEADAAAMADRLLVQARSVGWRLAGLELDTYATADTTVASVDDTARASTLLDLLDGTLRMGASLTLVDMPPYAPRGSISTVHLEGGSYVFDGGFWRLQLVTTPAATQGRTAQWGQLDPAWTWAQWSPGITYQDLYGVAA